MSIPEPIADVLRVDETLLWHGQPRTDFILVPYDWFLIPVAVSFTGFAAVICLMNASNTFIFERVVIGLLIAMLIVVFLRFPLDLMKRRNTYYLVTDKRIAIKTDSIFDRTVKSRRYDSDFTMTPIDAPKGSTTVYFGATSPILDFFYPPNYPLMDMFQPPAFIFLDNARSVMDIIIEAKRKWIAN